MFPDRSPSGMTKEGKEIGVDVYTENKKVLRTAGCYKPYSLKNN
jgi:hypothetical protein